MTQHFTIYQLNGSKEAGNVKFMGWEFVQKYIKDLNFSLDLYDEKYEDNIERSEWYDNTNEMLERIYTRFNLNRPQDFNGHSLSVSDIIQLGDKYYYCDSYGFKDITDYIIVKKSPSKTWKVTFFSKDMEIDNIITYHNIANKSQHMLVQWVITKIDTMELAKVVKVESEGEDYTEVFNEMIFTHFARRIA